MPRTKITTSFTRRVKPTTTYSRPRDCENGPFSFDSTEFTFDSTEWTFDKTLLDTGCIATVYNRPRKEATLGFADDTNYCFADDTVATLAGGIKTNIINTNWR